MARNTQQTKHQILEAAAQFGPDGATMEKIAWSAQVNKERVYNYYGDKQFLFAPVLRNELAKVAQSVPVTSFAEDDIAAYAGRAYDYHLTHPELSRLMRWEGLMFDGEVPDEAMRRQYYGYKLDAVADGQRRGVLATDLDHDHLLFLVLSLAGWWAAVPQLARMLTGPDSEQERTRRRASVVEAARRLATPSCRPAQ